MIFFWELLKLCVGFFNYIIFVIGFGMLEKFESLIFRSVLEFFIKMSEELRLEFELILGEDGVLFYLFYFLVVLNYNVFLLLFFNFLYIVIFNVFYLLVI